MGDGAPRMPGGMTDDEVKNSADDQNTSDHSKQDSVPTSIWPKERDDNYEQWRKMHFNALTAYRQTQLNQEMDATLAAELTRQITAASSSTEPRRELLMVWLVRAPLTRRFCGETLDILIVAFIASYICGGDLAEIISQTDPFAIRSVPNSPSAAAAAAAMPDLVLLWQIYTPEVLTFVLTYYLVMFMYQAL